MELSIGYFPKNYYDKDSDEGGFFPFTFDSTIPSVVSFGELYLSNCVNQYIPDWMELVTPFPLFCCVDIANDWIEEYDELLVSSNVEYRYLAKDKKASILLAKITSKDQFMQLIPFYITLGCVGFTVIWSNKEAIYSVVIKEFKGGKVPFTENKIALSTIENMSVFHIGHDGNSIEVISNELGFSSYENIISALPAYVKPSLCEFD